MLAFELHRAHRSAHASPASNRPHQGSAREQSRVPRADSTPTPPQAGISSSDNRPCRCQRRSLISWVRGATSRSRRSTSSRTSSSGPASRAIGNALRLSQAQRARSRRVDVAATVAAAVALDAPAEERDPLVDVAHAGLLEGERQPERRDRRLDLWDERLGVAPTAVHQHDEIVGVAHEQVGRLTTASPFAALPLAGSYRLPRPREVLVEGCEGDVRQRRRQDPAPSSRRRRPCWPGARDRPRRPRRISPTRSRRARRRESWCAPSSMRGRCPRPTASPPAPSS